MFINLKKYIEEIKIITKLLYNFILIYKNGFTEGQNIFNIKYDFEKFSQKLKLIKLFAFSIVKYILPYVISKIENYISRYNAEYESDFEKEDLKIWNPFYRNLLIYISKAIKFSKLVISILNFFNFINFISTNKFPYLVNRIFDFDYVFLFNIF